MKQKSATPLFFLTRSLFFGLGISLICKYTDKDTYIGAILGIMLGFFIVLGYRFIIRNKKRESLNQIMSQHKVIGLITRVLFLIASILLLTYSLITYKTFVTSFLLINTPVFIIFIPWLLLLIYCAWNGLSMIHKLASSLLPISIVLSLLSIISIIGNFEYSNFLPVLTSSPSNLFMTAISFAGISAFPGILSLYFDSDVKYYLSNYLLACFLVVIAILCINGVFGEVLVNVFRFPEYMVLKQVKLLNFIEKIENILSIAWSFDLFITSAFSIYSIKSLLPKKKNNLLTLGVIGIVAILIDKVLDFNYIYELFIYYALPYISLIFPILILFLFFVVLRKRKSNINLK